MCSAIGTAGVSIDGMSSSFWLSVSSGKIGFLQYFPDFPESWIFAQKQDTRAILPKTMLVCVSCIQNTQIRGKIIAKGFGKVDTFWTYQLPQA
jgi:hypothetical protein